MSKIITDPLIPLVLQDFDYYKNKLPLYLKSSEEFLTHFKLWHELLVNNIVDRGQELINMLNIFADDYFDFLQIIEGSGKDDVTSDILDKLGHLFGITRRPQVTYTHNNVETTEIITLTNEQFVVLIKARIIQNYCDGTQKHINDFYSLLGLNIKVITDEPATAKLYYIYYDNRPFDNIDKLFLSGLLKIESMGIKYRYELFNPTTVLVWDQINDTNSNGWGDDTYTGGDWVI